MRFFGIILVASALGLSGCSQKMVAPYDKYDRATRSLFNNDSDAWYVDHSNKCDLLVTQSAVPVGSEITITTLGGTRDYGAVSLGTFIESTKGLMVGGRNGMIIPLRRAGFNQEYRFLVTENTAKMGMAVMLEENSQACANNIFLDKLSVGVVRADFSGYKIAISVKPPI